MRAYSEDLEQIKGFTGRVTFKRSIGTNEAKRGEKSFQDQGNAMQSVCEKRTQEVENVWPGPRK